MATTVDAMLKLYEYSKKGRDLTDTYTTTQAKIERINDGLQTQAELQNKIFSASNQSRDSYWDMASSIIKLETLAGDAFGSNDETIKFAELAQESFKLGGGSSEEQSSGMDKLTEAMAGGSLQGDDFTSIMEDAPMLEQALANFTGKSISGLEKMGAQGDITAGIIKGALFAASDEIDSKFGMLPMTFDDVWTKIKNAGIQAFSGLMESVNALINTDGFEDLINNLIIGMFILGGVLEWVFNMATQNWGAITPILETIGGVLLVTIIGNLWTASVAAWGLVAKFIVMNWQLILVVAAIVIVITVLNALGISFKSVFEFIGGAIGVIIALFINMGKMVLNTFYAIANILNAVISGAVNLVIGGVNSIIGALNKIPGVDIESVGEFTALSQIEYLEPTRYLDAYSKGSNISGSGYDSAAEKLKGLTDKLTLDADGFSGYDDLGTSSNPVTVQGTGSDGTVDVDMGDEDLQYLRDIAERDFINKFSSRTLAPNIQVSFGDVHQTADVDQVASRMQKILQEQIATTGEGVY